MYEKTAKLLACPVCSSPLTFEGKTSNGRFINGYFKCSAGHMYQVKEQVGLLKDARISAKEFEWKVDVADEKKYAEIRCQYDSYLTQEQKVAMQRMKEKLVDYVSRSSTESDNMVLDIATGMGTFMASLLEKCSADAFIIGTDVDEKPLRGLMNKIMKAGTYPKLSLIVTDAKHLCFGNNVFFTVSSFFGFDNVPETGLAFKETSRVLQDGGRVFFNCLWYREGSDSMRLAEKYGICEVASEARLRKTLAQAGLVLDSVEETYSGVWPHNPMDLLPVEGDEYKHVIAHARKPKR
jgi:ubiquinone/menaquinone biosynthesis C-methylase UbiE